MSKKSDALSVFMHETQRTHIPAMVAEAFECGWRAAIESAITTLKNEVPQGTAIPLQHKDLTQDQYTRIGRILQGWGYDAYDICNLAVATKLVLRNEDHDQPA